MSDYNTALLVDHTAMGAAELMGVALTAGPAHAPRAPADLTDPAGRNVFGMLRAVEWEAATRMLNAVVRQGPKTAAAGIDIDHVMRLVGIVALMSAPKLATVLKGIDMDQPHNLAIGVPLHIESAQQLVAYLETGAAVARPLEEWDESMGDCLWWKFPVEEACYVGHPNCDDWPGYHTHFTPHPAMPVMGEPQVDPA
ncbi:hypothetical protein MW290_25660 [Aquincola tertiaricarbonis]|uniref:Uncharacterized protein n=1 Tax=Aquincola tertiaricarbonis TaxID=391953 RepID=A0ABY4S7I8_AQUTE|nr:hypothetical protein [Aquincola tertiaricarbonis]URI08959.1 hypothetical protein MW290_25660 [Aquincola tertiaricarbonis]